MKLIKIFIIVVLVLLFIFYLLNKVTLSGRKNIENHKENLKYLTIENYLLIKESPYSDELSEYTIWRKDKKLKFTRKGQGYTLFFLELETDNERVKLVGLDGYGIRDREFLQYIRNLVDMIVEKSNKINC